MKTKFQIYDIVRVTRLPDLPVKGERGSFRSARVGDTGTVVMVYEEPSEGYTVEGVAGSGRTEWLGDFLPDDLEKV